MPECSEFYITFEDFLKAYFLKQMKKIWKKNRVYFLLSPSDTIFQLLEKLIYNISIIKIYKLIYLQICIPVNLLFLTFIILFICTTYLIVNLNK